MSPNKTDSPIITQVLQIERQDIIKMCLKQKHQRMYKKKY